MHPTRASRRLGHLVIGALAVGALAGCGSDAGINPDDVPTLIPGENGPVPAGPVGPPPPVPQFPSMPDPDDLFHDAVDTTPDERDEVKRRIFDQIRDLISGDDEASGPG